MVDDRSMRFRQQAMPRVQPVQSTRRNAVADVNALMRGTDTRSGYSRADQDLVNRRGGELFLSPMSTLLDEAKNVGAVQRGTPASAGLTGAAFVADLLNPSFGLPIGVGGAQAANTASRVANLSPAAKQAYLNSLTGRLYHGSKSTEPFVVQRGVGDPDNLFGADFFTTTSRALAETPGYGAGRAHRVRLPLADAENLRVLDLMPGAPTVRDQFPGLADLMERLGRSDLSIGGSAATTVDPAALQQAVNAVGRHIPFTRSFSNEALVSPDNIHGFMDWGKVLRDQGINAVRHESGRLVPDAEAVAPVIAFLDPPPMRATPSISFDRLMENASDAIKYAPQNIRARISSLLNRLRVGRPPAYNPLIDEL